MPFLVFIGVLVVLAGPVALCICIATNIRISNLERRLNASGDDVQITPQPSQPSAAPDISDTLSKLKETKAVMQKAVDDSVTLAAKPTERKASTVPSFEKFNVVASPKPDKTQKPVAPDIQAPIETPNAVPVKKKESSSLEQRIGTQWILIGGVLAIIFGIGFFLKYAYDNALIGELGRVVIAVVCGSAALIAGEITRRRDYEIVAKAMTALGFAILYAAVFAAFGLYGLIGTWGALTISILITTAAMIYAFALDEIVIAFLSLLGGFLAPVLITIKHDIPIPLLSYVLVLSVGAMACACNKKWRSINTLAFVGSMVVYTLWFIRYYWPHVRMGNFSPKQMPIAVGAMIVFFSLYLIMPILFNIVKKTKAQKEDVQLILANAMVALFFFWRILHYCQPRVFAYFVIGMSAAHIVLMSVVALRYREDKQLRATLLSIGLALFVVAMPLFFGLYALTLIWAVEGVMLTVIGLRYRCMITKLFGMVCLLASSVNLILHLPMHGNDFRLIVNPDFMSWCFVAMTAYAHHLMYRTTKKVPEETKLLICQLLYSLSCVMLLTAASMEWYYNCRYNIGTTSEYYVLKGQTVIMAGVLLLLIARPLCPAGKLCSNFARAMACIGSLVTVAALFSLQVGQFNFIANAGLVSVMSFVAVLVVYHILERIKAKDTSSTAWLESQLVYGLIGVLLFAIFSAQWYWNCRYNLNGDTATLILKGQVILFALTVLFFVLRPMRPKGTVSPAMAIVFAGIGSLFAVAAFTEFYYQSFRLFFNSEMLIVLLFVLALAVAAKLISLSPDDKQKNLIFTAVFGLLAIVVLWILLTEEVFLYWYWKSKVPGGPMNWTFLAHMYTSIMWALYGAVLMVAGVWKRVKLLRYFALGLFAILLAKVFIIDTSEVESVYRIAAFLATGVTLVGVSYLYQYLKKQSFFENVLSEKTAEVPTNENS